MAIIEFRIKYLSYQFIVGSIGDVAYFFCKKIVQIEFFVR